MSVAVQPPQVILCGVSPCPAGCREGRGMPEVLGAAGQVSVLAEVWETRISSQGGGRSLTQLFLCIAFPRPLLTGTFLRL